MTNATCAPADCATLTLDRMPAITWHRLDINDTSLDVPASPAAPASAIFWQAPQGVRVLDIDTCTGSVAGDASLRGSFEQALLEAHASQAGSAADGSRAQLETGAGEQAAAWLAKSAQRHLIIELPAYTAASSEAVIHLDASDGSCVVALVDIIARAGSQGTVAIATDSPAPGRGIVGSLVRVFAEAGSHVAIDELQTLGNSWTHIDDMGIYAEDGASVEVSQTVLGGFKACVGLAADLAGRASSCTVDTRYLGHGKGTRDFNYIMRQRGAKTHAVLAASGILAGTSHKTLRGTIDLIHGCKGSVGRETETVLLASEKAENKSIPVILCDEDDVQGDHGATIGHVDPEQLAYMNSRGLDADQAQALFLKAAFDSAASRSHDEKSKSAVERLAREVLEDEASFEEGIRS